MKASDLAHGAKTLVFAAMEISVARGGGLETGGCGRSTPRWSRALTHASIARKCAGLLCLAVLLAVSFDAVGRDAVGRDASPIFGVTIPAGYRTWPMIAPSQETAGFDELRGILANEIAVKAFSTGRLPFPDGSILVKLAWKREPSREFRGAFVPGRASTIQIMVKDAKRYAATGGWGFGRFVEGVAVDRMQHETCFGCHAANVKNHDVVFTRFAP